MKMTKSKIAFLNKNASNYKVLSTIVKNHGKVPYAPTYDMENILNLLNNTDFFRQLGGKEYARINFDIDDGVDGETSLATIEMVSIAPIDGDKHNSKRVVFLTATTSDMYKLMGA